YISFTTSVCHRKVRPVTGMVSEAYLAPSAFEIAITASGVAVTADGAVYKPPGVMLPLLACHVTVVSAAFWTVALNCSLPPATTDAGFGLTETETGAIRTKLATEGTPDEFNKNNR